MKKLLLISTFLILLFTVGCRQVVNNIDDQRDVALTFAMSVESSDASSTKADVNTPFAKDNLIKVTVYKAGDTSKPIVSRWFIISDALGTAKPLYPQKTILLKSGSYDFYFSSKGTSEFLGTDVVNGQEAFASGKQTILVEPDADGNCKLSVTLKRMYAMLDVLVYYESTDGLINSMAINGDVTMFHFVNDGTLDELGAVVTPGAEQDYIAKVNSSAYKAVDAPEGANTKGLTTIDGSVHNGVVVIPETVAKLFVDVPLTINGVEKLYHVDVSGVKLEAGKYYTLKVKIGLMGEFSAIVEEWRYRPANAEMGVQDPSNTYITTPTSVGGPMKEVVFDATKKPRSTTGKVGHQGYLSGTESGDANLYELGKYPTLAGVSVSEKPLTTDLKASDIDKIEVVWQTMVDHGKGIDVHNGSLDFTKYNVVTAGTAFIKSVAYDKTTGLAVVMTRGTGNALIAAYDAGGTILWSWQIWGTETTPKADVDPGNSANGVGKMLMDRNLGALAATTSRPSEDNAYKYFGNYYQWGRKEPFTGIGPQYLPVADFTNPDDHQAKRATIFDKDGNWIQSSDEKTLTQPALNKKGGYECITTTAPSTYTLLTNPTTGYYANSIPRDNYGLITDNPNTWTPYSAVGTVIKSIYDPCPYGYRVPNNGVWSAWSETTGSWTQFAIDGGIVTRGSWWPSGGQSAGFGAFPRAISVESHYWSSSPFSSKVSEAHNLNFDCYSGSLTAFNDTRSSGNSVRCVQE